MKFQEIDHRIVDPSEMLKLIPVKVFGRFYDLKQIVFNMVEKNPKQSFHVFTGPKGISDKDALGGAHAVAQMFVKRGMKNFTCIWNKDRRVWLVYDKKAMSKLQAGKE